MIDRREEIAGTEAPLNGLLTAIVGAADDLPGSKSTPGVEHAAPANDCVPAASAAGVVLRVGDLRSAAELAGDENHHPLVEPALVHVFNEGVVTA